MPPGGGGAGGSWGPLEQISWMLIIDRDATGVRHDAAEFNDAYDRVALRLISMIDAGAGASALAAIWSRSKGERSVLPAVGRSWGREKRPITAQPGSPFCRSSWSSSTSCAVCTRDMTSEKR